MLPHTKRILIGVAVGSAAFTGLIFLLIHTLGDSNTLYRGRPIEFWVGQINNPKLETSNEVSVVVDTIIIPQLTETMFTDTNDFKLRLVLIEQLNGLPGVNIRYTPADGRRAEAAQNLGELGPHAKVAVPNLVKVLKGNDPAVRGAAVIALGKIGSEPDSIIPLLIAAMDDPQEGVPEAAVEALGDFGKLSKAAVPKILPLLKVPDKDMRHAANVALRKIDPAAMASKP